MSHKSKPKSSRHRHHGPAFTDFTSSSSSSYVSFPAPAPVFTTNIVVNQPTAFSPAVMASSQNFNTFNYPVFKKYGYYINGVYHSMAKKGTTRQRNKCLWRRGIPRLETIQEEPELESELDVQKLPKE